MNYKVVLIVSLALTSLGSQASERVKLFTGQGISLERSTDAMTDKTECAMFVQGGPVYLSVEGRSKVTIWAASDDLNFAFDSNHYLRIGQSKPSSLVYLAKRNGLAPASPAIAGKLVKALASGEQIHIRYVDWPSHEQADATVQSSTFAYAWGVAMKDCNWPSLGLQSELPPVKLNVYAPDDQGAKKGYANVSLAGDGDGDLSLMKSPSKDNDHCVIAIDSHGVVGRYQQGWVTETIDLVGFGKLVVRDRNREVLFEGNFPKHYEGLGGAKWDLGESAAKAMWRASPYGTVSVTGATFEKEGVSLYGFKELWKWGEQNCGLPTLEDATSHTIENQDAERGERAGGGAIRSAPEKQASAI